MAAKSQVTGLGAAVPVLMPLLPDIVVSQDPKEDKRFRQQNNVAFTTPEYFSMIGYRWIVGAPTALNEPFHTVLTASQAKVYFPSLRYDEMLGKAVMYDSLQTTIAGIVAPLEENTGFTFHDLISYSTILADNRLKKEFRLDNWGRVNVKSQLFIKIDNGATAQGITRQLNDILHRNLPTDPASSHKTQTLALQSLNDIHFSPIYGGIAEYTDRASRTTLYCLLAVAAFLLLLACINFINLTTAQSGQRAREIGIRKTLGSSRGQIAAQFLGETLLITIIALVLSLTIAPFILRLFSAFIPSGITLDLLHQSFVWWYCLALIIVVSLLSGSYPAAVLSAYKPITVLQNQAKTGNGQSRSSRLRKTLSVSQFVIAQFFIMAIIIVSKQIYYATHKDLGFKKDAIISIWSPFKNGNVQSDKLLLDKFRAMPGIDMISMGHDEPASENTSSTEAVYRDGKKEVRIENLAEKFGDANYINLYHIKLLAGRNLQPSDTNRAFLVNETFVRTIGLQDPKDAIGRVVDGFNGDRRMTIVGVVADFNQESLHVAIVPAVLLTNTSHGFSGTFHIALNGKAPDSWHNTIASIKREWHQIYPDDGIDIHFVDETVALLYEKEQQTATLLGWATGLSVLISCLGLLGLAMYTTAQRAKEIGVRKVLGASVLQIVRLLSSEIAALIGIAFLIATPLTWWAMNRWLQGFADHTGISWWIFVLSGGIMLLAALFTSALQTVRAAIANPVKSLQNE